MNRILGSLAYLVLPLGVMHPPDLAAADLEVVIADPPDQGGLVFVVFDSANSFGDFRDPFRVKKIPAGEATTHTFTGLPAGTYAVLVFSDRNDNQELDKNFIGIPIEPIGFSNDYEPRGPPQFDKASFVLQADERRVMTIGLRRILGKHGTWGIGAGVIYQSSPYRDSTKDVLQPIPAIIFVGNRLQATGPSLRYALLGQDRFRLAASARYRVGAYDESDSPWLQGMGDRDATVMAGLSLVSELPGGYNFIVGYQHDVLDRIGGGVAEAGFRKTFQWGPVSVSPALSVNWLSSAVASYDFGVSAEQSAPDRPAYSLGSALSPEVGVSVYSELGRHWSLTFNLGMEFLDKEIRNSPIVGQDQRFQCYLSVFYLF